MSLLYKETFDQYPVGHNLIGSGNMDWTVRKDGGSGVLFNVTAEKWGYLKSTGAVWLAISANHPNIINMTDGNIVIHNKQIVQWHFVLLFRYSASGGYQFVWLPGSAYMRINKFTGWDDATGSSLIVNLATSWMPDLREVVLSLNGANINLAINNKQIWNGNDVTYPSGTIGLANYYMGNKVDDIYIFDNYSTIPTAPTNLTLTILNANSIKLNFTNTAFNADYICIERKNGISGVYLEIDRAPGNAQSYICLLYTSPSPRDVEESRMPSSA